MSARDSLNGITSQNRRDLTVQRFIEKPPMRAAFLILYVHNEVPLTLAEWTRSECENYVAIASDVCNRVDEHGAEAPHVVTKFALCWLDENRSTIATKLMNHRKVDAELNGVEATRVIDGSMESYNAIQQRGTEVNMRAYLTGHQANLQGSMQIIDRLNQQNAALLEHNLKLQDALMKLTEDMLSIRSAFVDETSHETGEMSEAQKRAVELLEKLAPLVAGALLKQAQH